LASVQLFLQLDRAGVHVLPKHYYTPLPDHAWLRANQELWRKRSSLIGIAWDLDAQVAWLEDTCRVHVREVAGLDHYREVVSRQVGLGYGPIESQILHCVIRRHKPATIVEIGSGVSTACILHATGFNKREGPAETQVVCIEPHPRDAFRELRDVRHIEASCQSVCVTEFESLRAGDLLFIDSTHAVKVGSDVVRIYLDIIPRLPPGVLIQIHDIYLPYLYPRDVLESYFGWQETVLVQALLTNNERLSVLAATSALHYDRQGQLRELFPDYRPEEGCEGIASNRGAGHFPSSLWLITG